MKILCLSLLCYGLSTLLRLGNCVPSARTPPWIANCVCGLYVKWVAESCQVFAEIKSG